MSEDTATAEREEQGGELPQRGGLPAGRRAPAREPRGGDDLIGAAAADEPLSDTEAQDLLAYYLENEELPGDTATTDTEVMLGHGGRQRTLTCTIRPITWGEYQDAQERGKSADGQKFDTFVACSWNVARALVKPALGPVVVRQQDEAKRAQDGKISARGPNGEQLRLEPAADAAMLLRRMFVRQSGALLDLSRKVLEISKLEINTQSVREVEAAKN